VKGDFKFELQALCMHMMVEVLTTLVLFLSFSSTYNVSKVQNMLTLMLDPHFTYFDVMKTFVRKAKMIQMVTKYDNKTLIPFK
jgi:hypothetical protein